MHIVGLDGDKLLQCIGRTVGFKRPHFHFSKALTAELCLTAERLLRNKRIRPRGSGVHFVINQVSQLSKVDNADTYIVFKKAAGQPVAEFYL